MIESLIEASWSISRAGVREVSLIEIEEWRAIRLSVTGEKLAVAPDVLVATACRFWNSRIDMGI